MGQSKAALVQTESDEGGHSPKDDIKHSQSSSNNGDKPSDPSTSNKISVTKSEARKLEAKAKQQPYFYYQNQTDSSKPYHSFSLHSHPNNINHHDNNNNNNTLYSQYGTTITTIILLHILYFYQWNTRRTRQEVCTSYDQLVEKKQFYRAVVAVVSHPPVDGGEREINFGNNASSDHGMMEGGETMNGDGPIARTGFFGETMNGDGPIARTGFFGRFINCNLFSSRLSPIFQRIRPLYFLIKQRVFHPLVYGSLSGLPLLTFASHILWQCRSLEELYDEHDGKLILGVTGNDVNMTQFTGIGTASSKIQTAGDVHNVSKHLSTMNDGYTYFRVLIALAFTAILLELSLSRSMLKRIDQVVDFDGYRTNPRQLLSQRAMCSIASLATALLGVYDSHFPYAPPPVLPFVRVSFLSSSGFSLIFSIMILAVLTHRIHPVTSIISGLLSGSLWSLGVTSFLGTRYWGNVMLFSLAFGILLSLKAQPSYATYLKMFFPCIDYVGWDRDGEISAGTASNATNNVLRQSSHGMLPRADSNHVDLESGLHFRTQNGSHTSQERFPLLSTQSSSMSGHSSNAIRGRVPLINTMESDLDGVEDLVRSNEESMPAASSRFGASLSRRAGGSSN